MNISDKIQFLNNRLKAKDFYLSPQDRREVLLQTMLNYNCHDCNGNCCSVESNSMRVDPLQAFDIIYWLIENNKFDKHLIENIEEVISTFRLDVDVMIKKNQTLRRYYTCPFYLNKQYGCSISRTIKPYGCLAFNRYQENSCYSDQQILNDRDIKFTLQESQINQFIKLEMNLTWEQLDLPRALLSFISL